MLSFLTPAHGRVPKEQLTGYFCRSVYIRYFISYAISNIITSGVLYEISDLLSKNKIVKRFAINEGMVWLSNSHPIFVVKDTVCKKHEMDLKTLYSHKTRIPENDLL